MTAVTRIDEQRALSLLVEAPLIELMERGYDARQKLHPGREVTFVVDTNPNYTNVCVTECTFCSFYRKQGASDAYVLTPDQIAERVSRAALAGATTVLLQGGHHPDLDLDYYLEMIRAMKLRAPSVHLHLFSPSEIVQIASASRLSIDAVLDAFWDAGLRTLPGGGAEILVDRVRRRISPKKIRSDEWLGVMRRAHLHGFKTSATMMYGHIEEPRDLIEHLSRLRALQDETHGFYAFIPWSFKPGNSPASRMVTSPALSSLYVRIIAVARLFLDNVAHIQASWFGEGVRAGQLALSAGADDFGGLLIEENVLKEARHSSATTLDRLLSIIDQAGFVPIQRTTLYERVCKPAVPAARGDLVLVRASSQ